MNPNVEPWPVMLDGGGGAIADLAVLRKGLWNAGRRV